MEEEGWGGTGGRVEEKEGRESRDKTKGERREREERERRKVIDKEGKYFCGSYNVSDKPAKTIDE